MDAGPLPRPASMDPAFTRVATKAAMSRAHHLVLSSRAPGRARWRSRALRSVPHAEAVASSLRSEKAVTSVEVNTLTGSVLVTFVATTDLHQVEEVVRRALPAKRPRHHGHH